MANPRLSILADEATKSSVLDKWRDSMLQVLCALQYIVTTCATPLQYDGVLGQAGGRWDLPGG
jgi:hypothetical protein